MGDQSASRSAQRRFAQQWPTASRMRAGWAYFASWPDTAKDFAQMAQTQLTMPVLSIAGEKASAAILGPQMKRVATDVKIIELKGSGHWLMEERPKDGAAIASELAAQTYGAHILKRGIEDDRQNFTRFFLLEPAGAKPRTARGAAKHPWKTSLVFSIRNVPGALFRSLGALALRDINLVKIESRPLRGKPWEYLFYLDLWGHRDDQVVRNALSHLQELADFLRVLGSYRAA